MASAREGVSGGVGGLQVSIRRRAVERGIILPTRELSEVLSGVRPRNATHRWRCTAGRPG